MSNRFSKYDLPCTDPERRDDWFISERNPLEPEDRQAIVDEVNAEFYPQLAGWEQAIVDREIERRVDAATAALKLRRRKAIQSCYFECPMRARLECLDEGLKPQNLDFGIWGAYPETDRRNIRTAIDARDTHMSDADAAYMIVRAENEKKEALNPR